MSIRAKIKNVNSFPFPIIRSAYYYFINFTIPSPRFIWVPVWSSIKILRTIFHWIIRVFWVTPNYKALCEASGKGFTAGTSLPFVMGKGRLLIGNNVSINGKQDYLFASIKNELPIISIGNNTSIGSNVTFVTANKIEIGDDCLIAQGVTFQDSNGHSMDPESRKNKLPPSENEIKPIKIGNNVWIGTGAFILPGVKIGDNCVISAYTTVSRNIPKDHLVYPASPKVLKLRKIGSFLNAEN